MNKKDVVSAAFTVLIMGTWIMWAYKLVLPLTYGMEYAEMFAANVNPVTFREITVIFMLAVLTLLSATAVYIVTRWLFKLGSQVVAELDNE